MADLLLSQFDFIMINDYNVTINRSPPILYFSIHWCWRLKILRKYGLVYLDTRLYQNQENLEPFLQQEGEGANNESAMTTGLKRIYNLRGMPIPHFLYS